MRSRLFAVTLCLCMGLFGCSGKSKSADGSSASGDVAAPSSDGSGTDLEVQALYAGRHAGGSGHDHHGGLQHERRLMPLVGAETFQASCRL